DSAQFEFRGVRYQMAQAPVSPGVSEGSRIRFDLAAIAGAGYTLVSLSPPAPSTIEHGAASGLRFMLELDGASCNRLWAAPRRERKRLTRELAMQVRRSVQPWRGTDALLGVALGGFGQVGSGHAGGRLANR